MHDAGDGTEQAAQRRAWEAPALTVIDGKIESGTPTGLCETACTFGCYFFYPAPS